MDAYQTTVSAASILYNFINACAEFSDDAKSLARRFAWDLRVLRHVCDYFTERLAATSGKLNGEDQQLLDTSLAYLGELMNRIMAKRSRIETNGWLGTQWNRALWIHYKKDLTALEQELFEWTNRFDLRLVAMPPALKNLIHLDDPSTRSAPRLAMQRRIEKYLALSPAGKNKIKDDLVVTDPSSAITFLPNPPSRRMTATYNSKTVIVEYKPHGDQLLSDPAKLQEATDVVSELAGALSVVDPTLIGLLPCTGFFHSDDLDNPRFGFLYAVPFSIGNSNPPTIKDLLKATDRRGSRRTAAHPLDQRLNLARQIACALFFYHSVHWVHKSIRSDNIVMLEREGLDAQAAFPYTLGSPYLVNFSSAREDVGTTDLSLEQQENEWFLNVYRHPARQGANISARFTMAHDAYSLGVVLLEIGMWRPLERSEVEIKGKTPKEVRKVLIKMADGSAIQMGSRYKDLVLWCLGLEDVNLGMTVYAEQVLERLESLVI